MDNTNRFSYFYGNESEQFRFYRIPKLLIVGEMFRDLSTDAKLLYGLMLDRMSLSAKNRWLDEHGRVFIYYPINEIEEDLNCGHNKAIRLMAELDQNGGIGLIERRRQGQGKPSQIFVKRFSDFGASRYHFEASPLPSRSEVSKQDFLKFENQTSGGFIFKPSEVPKSNAPTTKKNNTELSIPIESDQSDDVDGIDRALCLQRLREQVEYSTLSECYQGAELDEIMALIVDVLCSTNTTIRVNGSQIPIRFVKERFHLLDRFHIQYVIDCFRENTTSVRNIRAYLLTTLYNAPTTIEHYYKAKVQHDLYGQ